jgi:hypothetical protein
MRIIMHKATAIQSFDFGTLTSGYDAGTFTPVEVAHAVVARIAAAGDDRVWISRVPNAALLAHVNQYEVLTTREKRDVGVTILLPTEVCERKGRDGEMVFPAHPRTDDPNSPSRHGR